MKKCFNSALSVVMLSLALSFYSCGNNKSNETPIYTPGNPADSAHVSGGIESTGRGEEIFRQKCIACHGLEGNYRGNNAANLQYTRLDSIGIVTTVRNGKGTMPLFSAEALPDSDLGHVELFVRSLRK